MNTFLKFLQSSSGELSSKRLAFIFCQPFIILMALRLIEGFIDNGDSELAFKVFVALCVYSSLLGGMVTSELLLKLTGRKK